jgi:hypothetical protein
MTFVFVASEELHEMLLICCKPVYDSVEDDDGEQDDKGRLGEIVDEHSDTDDDDDDEFTLLFFRLSFKCAEFSYV